MIDTAKAKVRRRFKDAYSEKSAFLDGWYVWRESHDAPLGRGYSAAGAWADAARKLKRQSTRHARHSRARAIPRAKMRSAPHAGYAGRERSYP